MASKNVETHRSAHEAWNRRDFNAIAAAMQEDITYVDHARGITITTRDDFIQWVSAWAQFFSDGKITEARYLDAGDTVVAQFTGHGTNDGPFGPYPATGREATFGLCEFLRFNQQGRIVGGEIYYDQLSLLVQLGHVEMPEPAAAAS